MSIIRKTEYFNDWLLRLRDIRGKAKILARLKRAELGNCGDCKTVGCGVFEMRIDFGPGYRLYFSRIQGAVIILVGGDKRSQARDIRRAQRIAREIGG